MLSLMNPLSSKHCDWILISYTIQYDTLDMGMIPSANYIPNSTSLSGRNLDKSFGNTF